MDISTPTSSAKIANSCHPVASFQYGENNKHVTHFLPLDAVHQLFFSNGSTLGKFQMKATDMRMLQMQHADMIESICGLPIRKGDLNCGLNTTGFTPCEASTAPIRMVAMDHNIGDRANRKAFAVPKTQKIIFMPMGDAKDEWATKREKDIQNVRYATYAQFCMHRVCIACYL